MRCGAVPVSSKASTRSVSTLVLPDPADAVTQTFSSGLMAVAWSRLAMAMGPADKLTDITPRLRLRPKPIP